MRDYADAAVLFSGWLNVSVPEAGATARAALISPWRADVLVAATYLPHECSTDRCVRERLVGLGPLSAVRIDPMLTVAQLNGLVVRSPHWRSIALRFRRNATYLGVHWSSPLLGDPRLSVLRELHDYSRAHALLVHHEATARGGRRYARIIHSRMEYRWLAPHPPPRLLQLSEKLIWVPSGEAYSGVNDRHAVMARSVANVYFRRLDLLLSRSNPDPVKLLGWSVLLSAGPERLLAAVLRAFGISIATFPSTMLLGCCSSGSGSSCFSSYCVRHPTIYLRPLMARPGASRNAEHALRLANSIEGKYKLEMVLAAAHAQALSCPGASFAKSVAWGRNQRGASSSVGVVVQLLGPPLGLLADWHPDMVARRQMRRKLSVASTSASNPRARQYRQKGGLAVAAHPVAQRSETRGMLAWSSALQSAWVTPVEAPKAQARRWRWRLLRHQRMVATGPPQNISRPPSSVPSMTSRAEAALGDVGSPEAEPNREGVVPLLPVTCPDYPRQWWPRNATVGHCGSVEPPGTCTDGSKGRFPAFRVRRLNGHPVALSDCARLCARCERCAYISVSLAADTAACHWYAEEECDSLLGNTDHDHDHDGQRSRHLHAAGGTSKASETESDGSEDFVTISLLDALRNDVLCKVKYGEHSCS